MSLDTASQLGKVLGKLSSDQDDIKENISPDQSENQDVVFAKETYGLGTAGTILQKDFPEDSFILDHPVYGDIDSSTLLIDGGYSCQSGLVRYYQFNSDDTDSVVNEYFSGTNGTGFNYSGDWETTGKLNSARNFNGTNQSVGTGAIPEITIGSPYSVACWFYPTNSIEDYNTVIEISQNSSDRFVIIQRDNNIVSGVYNGTAYTKRASPIVDNTWYNCVCTWDGVSSFNMYINGVTTTDLSINPVSGGVVTGRIGCRTDSTEYFEGKIDEFLVWDRVLSEDEATRLYNSGVGTEYPFEIASDILHSF